MFEFRVTKYDPVYRDASGAFMRDEWTSVGDIGRPFSGEHLTEVEYGRVEDAYVVAAISFMREAGVASLVVSGLENHTKIPLSFGDGASLHLEDAGAVIRRVLREQYWCRLEASDGFIHLGYDYTMYVGVKQSCPATVSAVRQRGLFVEPFPSPYSERGDI